MSGPRQAAADRAATVRLVLAQLESEGVRVLLNAAGDGVRLEAAGPPSAEVVRLARTHRSALLEALAEREEGAPASPVYSTSRKIPDPLAHPEAVHSSFARQLDALALMPGHCGVCARWEALTAPLAHMGECSAGRRAHGWYDGPSVQAVEIHAAHACTAWEGKGFLAKASGKRPAPCSPAEPGVSR